MKRILIIGASVLQLPAIQKAKEMGMYVGVVDRDSKAVGVSVADEFYRVSTVDEKGVYEAARIFKPDGIMTLATDMPMRSVAYATEKLGLKGISYDTAIKATDKVEMIKAFEQAGVAHPWYYSLLVPGDVEKIKKFVTYPCISKPVDNAGSRGVVLIQNAEELMEAVQYSSLNGRNGAVIVEEFLQGKEVSVEVIVVNSVPYVLQVTDKLTTGAPHFVEMGHSEPSVLAKESVGAIKELAIKAVKAVGLENGPAHVEIMMTNEGPKMIELGARMGGDCITTHLVPLSTGIDMVEATIKIALGEAPNIEPKFEMASAIRYFREQKGTIKNISGIEQAKKSQGIQEVVITKNIGESIGTIYSSMDRMGYVIAQGNEVDSAINYCKNAIEKITVEVE